MGESQAVGANKHMNPPARLLGVLGPVGSSLHATLVGWMPGGVCEGVVGMHPLHEVPVAQRIIPRADTQQGS